MMTELVVDFVSDLGGHASRHRVIDEIRDAIDDFGKSAKAVINQSKDGAEAGEYLDAVGDSNQAVVTRIGLEVVLLHDVLARR